MADLLVQDEAVGPVPEGLDAVAWRRIESWTARRWTPRTVQWGVHGPGLFTPPLGPVVAAESHVWAAGQWMAEVLVTEPDGYLLSDGRHRITATVGAGPVPVEVAEAARRLAAYLASVSDELAAGTAPHTTGRDGDYGWSRSPQWAAKAMAWSGAGDLLRGYRRA